MRTLILMRHAKSDWNSPQLADHDRPLNARGRRAAPLMARHLLGMGTRTDVILASSALRVQETLTLLQSEWEPQATVWTVPNLYLASPQEIIRQVEALHDDWHRAMVIGHNPGLSLLASQLSGEPMELPTAAIALFTSTSNGWTGALTSATWTLEALWKPRDLEHD